MAGVRKAFHWLHLVAATLVVVGVFVQVYLAAAALFGATDMGAHEDSGGIFVHNAELLVLLCAIVAWLPRADIGWSFLLAAVGTGQIFLAEADEWVAAIHGVGALVVLVLAAIIVHRDLRALGLMRRPAAGT